jgi:hypothetical protein
VEALVGVSLNEALDSPLTIGTRILIRHVLNRDEPAECAGSGDLEPSTPADRKVCEHAGESYYG